MPPDGLLRHPPCGVRIVRGHLPCGRICARAKILLAHDTVLIDDERHDARRIVLRRPRDEREPTGHLALDDIAFGSARGSRSLRGQDLEVVAMKWRRLRRVPRN